MLIGPLAGLAGALVMVLTIWVPLAPLAGFSFFLFGAGPVLWAINAITLRQVVTPGEVLGRVSAIISMTPLVLGRSVRPLARWSAAPMRRRLGWLWQRWTF